MLKALDLFCGGGGAGLGLMQAGFEVTGVDIEPHDNYPGKFILGDVFKLNIDLNNYDFIWASPPCQKFSNANNWNIKQKSKKEPVDLIPQTRNLIKDHPYTCIENVPAAPIRKDLVLSGPMFGLNRILRVRHFELSYKIEQPIPIIRRYQCEPHERVCVTKSGRAPRHFYPRKEAGLRGQVEWDESCEAMGIDITMTREEVGEAIPPAYSYFIALKAKEIIDNV